MAAGKEPLIKVGLICEPQFNIVLEGEFVAEDGARLGSGGYVARRSGSGVTLEGSAGIQFNARGSDTIAIAPVNFESSKFTVHGVTIGIDFHWQRRESQTFQGSLIIKAEGPDLRAINELPLESYLVSVISSEMSASSPAELLKAHSIISRSWLLAQLEEAKRAAGGPDGGAAKTDTPESGDEIIRWYTREAHRGFDVCSDDHCQRYQGIGKAFSASAFDAVSATRGQVVTSAGEICDARYSKCCGGITERYSAAWDDKPVSYLSSIYDGDTGGPDLISQDRISSYGFPLSIEGNAARWITSAPEAFCNVNSESVLSRILPGFDQETADFYRWRVSYTASELRQIVRDRLGVDVGEVRDMAALERGDSGRIIRLQITGGRRTIVVGKELEIRRALSRSHLYSSAFVIAKGRPPVPTGDVSREKVSASAENEDVFTLIGAGWGHGVGLCQIGAAVMAERGFTHGQILTHYFTGAELRSID
ncbi:MAG: SpoIID/LytB domain-containing protein [Blastocatellia bacterium]